MSIGQAVVHRPRTLEEALRLLGEHGDDALPIAGGTELVLVMKLGLASVPHLVELTRVPELRGVAVDADGSLSIGACTTHWQLVNDPTVGSGWRSLAHMESTIGNLRVQTAGTLGGNLAFADPESDPATYLTVLGAAVLCWGPGGRREVPLSEFLQDAHATALEEGEVLGRVRVPALHPDDVVVHRKVAFGERPDVTCTVVARVEDGRVEDLRLGIGSVTARPISVSVSELVGTATDEALRLSGPCAAACVDSVADDLLSAKRRPHKLAVAQRLVHENLSEALRLAGRSDG